MSTTQPRLMPRYAHLAGTTFCTYTPDGKWLLTAGNNNIIRKFDVAKFDDEPVTIEHSSDGITGIATLNDKFVTCGDDGVVNLFDMATDSMDKLLLQTSLPARSIAISPDGNWVAVSSEELCVRIVNTLDHLKTFSLRDPVKPVKHVTFHPSGSYITCSGCDGIIYIYSLTTEPPTLLKKIEQVIPLLEPDSEASSKAVWHPSGESFAVATPMKDIHVIDRSSWKRTRVFSGGHAAEITDIQWSSNGAFLCSAGMDGKLLVWEAKTQVVVTRFEYRNITAVAWHPKENKISFTTSQGQLLTLPEPVPESHVEELLKPRSRIQVGERGPPQGQQQQRQQQQRQEQQRQPERERRKRSPDMLDELMGGVDDTDFIEDDDGAGYVQHSTGFGVKRGIDALDDYDDYGGGKRFAGDAVWRPSIQEPFQPGSTPWKGSRKYLCVNLIGIVWTVDQDTHYTVTVEFYDREQYRGFHFMDPFMYDKACLNENGTLFSNQPKDDQPAVLFYRPHETWTSRSDWKTQLPPGEEITSIALTEHYVIACTSTGYVRVFTLFGTPVRVYRQKHLPFVTCSAWRDYVFIVGNGPVGSDGTTLLTYTIENIRRDEVIQNADSLPLPSGHELKSVFWSDAGDPYIYDTSGTLLVLLHWRSENRAKWVPILDTKLLDRQLSGKVEESYWPVAVAQDKFHCIILKGGDTDPYFPRPLLSEFDFRLPTYLPKPNPTLNPDASTSASSTAAPTADELAETFVRESVMSSLKEDTALHTESTTEQRIELTKRENAIDKALIQLLAYNCRDDDGGERALEVCTLFKQRRSWELAVKVALKYQRVVLAEKIGELRGEKDVEEMEE